jgi:hypothetical protein
MVRARSLLLSIYACFARDFQCATRRRTRRQ